MQLTTKENEVNEFISAVMDGIECWRRAGEIVIKALETNPNFIDEVCDANPDLTPELVNRFVQIGRNQLCPKLLISDAPGVRRLRRLPFALQEKYASEPVTLLLANGEKLMVDVRNLTPDQAVQVFDRDDVRSEAAQRAFMEDKVAKRNVPPSRSNLPYRATGRKLVIMQPCTIDRKELARLVAEME